MSLVGRVPALPPFLPPFSPSLKLLLMTATPITDDHMSCVKILNLLLEDHERFPEEFDTFKMMFSNIRSHHFRVVILEEKP